MSYNEIPDAKCCGRVKNRFDHPGLPESVQSVLHSHEKAFWQRTYTVLSDTVKNIPDEALHKMLFIVLNEINTRSEEERKVSEKL